MDPPAAREDPVLSQRDARRVAHQLLRDERHLRQDWLAKEKLRVARTRRLCWRLLLLDRVSFKNCDYYLLSGASPEPSRAESSSSSSTKGAGANLEDICLEEVELLDEVEGSVVEPSTSGGGGPSSSEDGGENKRGLHGEQDPLSVSTPAPPPPAPPPPRAQQQQWKPSAPESEERISSAIRRDVNRTLPNEPLFATPDGHLKLFRVLTALSKRLWEVGYCQGLNFLAATLLAVFAGDEEVAFQCCIALLWRHQLVDFFSPSFHKLGLAVWKFETLVQGLLPQLCTQHRVIWTSNA